MKKFIWAKEKNLNKIITVMCLIAILLFGVICCGCSSSVKDNFVKYENASTLVIITYGEPSLLGYQKAGGFIDDSVLKSYENGTLGTPTIKVYHPYIEGRYVTVNVNTINSLSKETYSSFYSKSPYKY